MSQVATSPKMPIEQVPLTEEISAQPFENDGEYIEAEIGWLATRTRRLAAAQEVTESELEIGSGNNRRVGQSRQVSDDEAVRILTHWQVQEGRCRAKLDARLAGHRAEPDAAQLGLDAICEEHDLGTQERIILITCMVVGLGEIIARQVLSPLGFGIMGSLIMDQALTILDPKTLQEGLQARRLFQPTGQLVHSGLVTIEHPTRFLCPEDQLGAWLHISWHAFARIVGVPGLAQVREPKT